MSKRARRSYSVEEKVGVLREHRVEGKAVSEVCERHGVIAELSEDLVQLKKIMGSSDGLLGFPGDDHEVNDAETPSDQALTRQ
jgi:transposase-like protein